MSTINTSVDTCSVEVPEHITSLTQPDSRRNLSSPGVSPKNSCTLSTSIPSVAFFNTLKSEAPSKHRRGSFPNAERLARHRDHSTGSLEDIYRKFTNKRLRDPELPSPPHKRKHRKSSSFPPASRNKDKDSLASNVSSAMLSPTMGTNDNNEISSLTELLWQMQTWHTEDRTYLDQMKTDLSAELLTVKESNALLIEAVKQEIAAENNVLRTNIAQIKSRLDTLEKLPSAQKSNTSNSVLAPSLNKQIVSSAISSVEKHLRRNYVIISGLEVANDNAFQTVNNFIASHFNLNNSMANAVPIGKSKNRLKATFADNDLKNM